MGLYFDELKRSMDMLGQHEKTVFIGQAVEWPGTAMFNTLKDVSQKKKLEFPVAEELQMGASIGLALEGFIPISIYPRWNFLLLAVNQLVNHLDKLPYVGYPLGVIIRVGIGSERPLDPQHQHKGDFTEAFAIMLKNVRITDLHVQEEIFDKYVLALDYATKGISTILVESGDAYNEK